MKCEDCIYYKLATQHDYIIENQTNAYCLKYEDKCIPKDVYNKQCEDFKDA